MKSLLKLLTILLISTALGSCGGSSETSSGGSSGFGGTGISLVRGNVSSVDGQPVAKTADDWSESSLEWLISDLLREAVAQSTSASELRVSGGGRDTTVDSSGRFELVNVEPSENLLLIFSANGSRVATLSLGLVGPGAVVEVRNVRINTATGSATPDTIAKEESQDDNSSDDDSLDDISEDDDSSDDDNFDDDNSDDMDSSDDNSSDDSSDDD